MNSQQSALIGSLLTLPILLLNSIAGNEAEPFFTLFKIPVDDLGANPFGLAVFVFSLLLLVVGVVLNLRHSLQKGADGKRRLSIPNLVVAFIISILLLAFVSAFVGEYVAIGS